MLDGTAAIVAEAEALGDAGVLENLHYILHGAAGDSECAFQNGWLRDRSPDGSELAGRHGMRLADFMLSDTAQRGQLEEAHVVALRLYSTSVSTTTSASTSTSSSSSTTSASTTITTTTTSTTTTTTTTGGGARGGAAALLHLGEHYYFY